MSLIRCYSILLLFLGLQTIHAQMNNYTTIQNCTKKTKEWYLEAYRHFQSKDFDKAINLFEKINKKDPTFVNAYIQLGFVYEYLKNPALTKSYFLKAIDLAPEYNPQTYLALSRTFMKEMNYDSVVWSMNVFLGFEKIHPNLKKIAERRLADAKFRPKAINNPVKFEPRNLGTNINSVNREYFPSISIEDMLVYTVQIGSGKNAQEDLYYTNKTDGLWSKGARIPQVNTDENEGAQHISADGKFLVFTVCNRPGDYGSCDLYFSKKVNGRWSRPQNMGTPVNTGQWESQPSVSAMGNELFFVRSGARGQGNMDLYHTVLQEDGSWSEPKALSELNTSGHESAPCIHPDGKTLYFSSDAYPGMGGFDLYCSKKENGLWTHPVNLGFPINTDGQEESIAVSRRGELAYMASDRPGGYGLHDIYEFELPEAVRPEPVTYLKGIVKDVDSQEPLSAKVAFIDLETDKLVFEGYADEKGSFLICMPEGKYALNASKEGYLFYSEHFLIEGLHTLEKPLIVEAFIERIPDEQKIADKGSKPVILKNVFFNSNSSLLKKESFSELNQLYLLLKKNSKSKIQISGYTDNVGSQEDNLELSNKRAQAVVEYLIKKGISVDRMVAKGFGEKDPIASNKTEIGRALNRRTTFQLIF